MFNVIFIYITKINIFHAGFMIFELVARRERRGFESGDIDNSVEV